MVAYAIFCPICHTSLHDYCNKLIKEKKMEDPILTQIKELKDKAAALEVEYSKRQKGAWPKVGDTYNIINAGGQIVNIHFRGNDYNHKTLEYGNVFRDKETAEKRSRYLGALQTLMSLADTLNGDWRSDWGGLGSNYRVLFHGSDRPQVECFTSRRASGEVSFKTRVLAQEALDALTEEHKTILAEGYS